MKPLIVHPNEGIFFGNQMVCKISSDQTEGAFCSFETTLLPGEGIALHVHSKDDEFYYILEGELEMICGEHEFTAHTGAIIVIPRTVPHAFSNQSKSNTRFLNLFLPGGFDQMVESLSNLSPEESKNEHLRDQIRSQHGVRFIREDPSREPKEE